VTDDLCASPFLAAGLPGGCWERIQRRTIAAGLISLVGVVVIVAGSVGGGHIVGECWRSA